MKPADARSPDRIVILDAGGQYTHLIARAVREIGVYSEILPFDPAHPGLKGAKGLIVSGGPRSVLEAGSPQLRAEFFGSFGRPVLGICYGHQLLAHALGGEIRPGQIREYGKSELHTEGRDSVLSGLKPKETVWMSHGDSVVTPPPGFDVLARTAECAVAAMGDRDRGFYGVQFHPEVAHTPSGKKILRNFVIRVCRCRPTWSPAGQVLRMVRDMRRSAAGRNVFFLVSGGVDSTVAFTLCVRALGQKRVRGTFVDTGLMRKNESRDFLKAMRGLGYRNIEAWDRSRAFLDPLAGVTDPEEKRKKIGDAFLVVYREVIENWEASGRSWLLGQGTIYPDTIESGGTPTAAVIKTHHNRVAAIQDLIRENRVIEPLTQFYKDEVRALGRRLGLPPRILRRLPFPGPGLGVRCLCSAESQPIVRDAGLDALLGKGPVQGFILPVRSVGVQGDGRTYAHAALLTGRAPLEHLASLATRITNRMPSVNRVCHLVALRRGDRIQEARSVPAGLTAERVERLREADAWVDRVIRRHVRRLAIWQFPVVLLPVQVAGGEMVVLRPVGSRDGMTANFARLPAPVLRDLSEGLLGIPGIGAVLYDLTDKPPATIEWE